MEEPVFENDALGRYIANFEANPAATKAVRRINIRTDRYENFKRLKNINCQLQLDWIILDVQDGTKFDESLRSTLDWLFSNVAKKVEQFVVITCTPTQASLDFMLPLLDNAALDLSGSKNYLTIIDEFDDSGIPSIEAVYRRSTKLLDYFPSLTIRFHWELAELNTINTILVKAALQAKSVETVIFTGLEGDAGDQLGAIVGKEVDQVHLTELIFEGTQLSLVRFPHEIVEKSENLTKLVIEYLPEIHTQDPWLRRFTMVSETRGFEAIRKTLVAGSTLTSLRLLNITNLKTNDGFNLADCMPNLEYLEIQNTDDKPFRPPYPNLDLTLTDIASMCGPSLKNVFLQVGAFATVANQAIDRYINAALIEFQQKCPNLEILQIVSMRPYVDISYRDNHSARRSLVNDNHRETTHNQVIAQADTCKFTPAKHLPLKHFRLSFSGEKTGTVSFRRIFNWAKDSGYARLVDLEYDVENPDDFHRKVVHLPIELEEFHGVPDLMVHNWADIVESLPQAEDNIRPAELY